MNEQVGPPAGWYPDPEDPSSTRYWDGAEWTEQRAPAQPAPGQFGASAPPGPAPQVVQASTSGMAVASLVLGILWIYGIGSVLAIIFGAVAKGRIRDSGGTVTGGGMATAGIVLGIIGAVIAAILIVVGLTGDTVDYSIR